MKTYPLAVPDDLLREVRSTAKEIDFSMADTMRQAIKFGLPQLRKRMSLESADPDLTEVILDTWEKLGPAPNILYDKL